MGQIFYHGMLLPLHDSMPSFMSFRGVLDLLEVKNHVSQCLRPSDGGRVFDIHSYFLHGTKACNQGHIFDFFNQFICTGAYACSSNLNYAHKMRGNFS